MRTAKEIEIRKKDIIAQITDLKVNLNAISLINNKLKEEKRYLKYDFPKRSVKEKRDEILKILKKENELTSWAEFREKTTTAEYPAYTKDFYQDELNNVLAKPILIKSTGVLKISGEDNKGEVHFLNGVIVYVSFNKVFGERGFFDIVKLNAGIAQFYIRESIDVKQNISREISTLIIDTVINN